MRRWLKSRFSRNFSKKSFLSREKWSKKFFYAIFWKRAQKYLETLFLYARKLTLRFWWFCTWAALLMVHQGVYIDRHWVRMSSKPLEPLDEVYHENLSIYTLLMVLMGSCSDYHWYSWCVYTYYLGQNSAEVIVVILVTVNFGDGCKRQKVFRTVFDFGAKCDHFVTNIVITSVKMLPETQFSQQ